VPCRCAQVTADRCVYIWKVFNIGADETAAKGVCSVESTFSLERSMIDAIKSEFGKTPEGWEEIFFDAGAATKDTIVNAWARHNASSITSTGRRAVESSSEHFYFTGAAPGGPSGWSKCHYDIGTGVPSSQRSLALSQPSKSTVVDLFEAACQSLVTVTTVHRMTRSLWFRNLLLGGEVSMWSDTYCGTAQCGASVGAPPVGHKLFPPSADAQFSKSIGMPAGHPLTAPRAGWSNHVARLSLLVSQVRVLTAAGGMIWPRGYVAAGSFWNFNASVDPSTQAFQDMIYKLNDDLSSRGSFVCPSHCSCDQLSACGKPY
jgi:hypothetical protein